ncbi:MAG: ABC transporter ATP-binding protein [Spirochaetales bacterium]
MDQHAIETHDLTVHYGRHRGIRDVNLTVSKGEVFGFLGPNGAGKTTTQRVLLDVIRPTSGSATVFGLDSRTQGREVRKRVGYLPGDLSLYETMTARDYLKTMASLETRIVDRGYLRALCDRLGLDPTRKISEYSRGNRQKVGIVSAFMSRPDLLILDEPTTGLDPLVQRTVLDLVREAKSEGRTVFFSSHILQEVQSVCDRVGIIRAGELVETEGVEALTGRRFTRLRVTLRTEPSPDAFAMNGVTELSRTGTSVLLEVREHLEDVVRKALELGIDDLSTQQVTLEEVFLAFYGEQGEGGDNG